MQLQCKIIFNHNDNEQYDRWQYKDDSNVYKYIWN